MMENKDWLIIFTTSAFKCKYCEDAKNLLRLYGVNWFEKDIHVSEEYKQEFLERGFKSVPQCYHEKNLIGGYEKLKEYLRVYHSEKARKEKEAYES